MGRLKLEAITVNTKMYHYGGVYNSRANGNENAGESGNWQWHQLTEQAGKIKTYHYGGVYDSRANRNGHVGESGNWQ